MKTYIVLDLEWNQSPRGKNFSLPNLPFEIIEIGAIKLNTELDYISSFHSFIKPKIYKDIHQKVAEVINIEFENLKTQGEKFKKVAQDFYNWCFYNNEEPTFCTWGNLDLYELQRNISFYKLNLTFNKPLFYYDIQKLYLLHENKKLSSNIPRTTLHQASEILNIKDNRDFHSAINDAYYTCKVMKKINFKNYLQYFSIDYFNVPTKKSEEIYIEFPSYSKYISCTYNSKQDIMRNKQIFEIFCFKCKKMLKKRVKWFSLNNKIFYCICYCKDDGYLKGKLRIKTFRNKKLYVVKTIKQISKEDYLDFLNFKNEHEKNLKNKIITQNK